MELVRACWGRTQRAGVGNTMILPLIVLALGCNEPSLVGPETAVSDAAAPVAAFTYDCADLTCDFDGSPSSDVDGAVTAYAWRFGDGGTATAAIVQHVFSAPGEYEVSLEVRDDDGATGSSARRVIVTAPPGDDPPGDDPPVDDPPADDPLNTTIYPGESIQDAVDANPAGTEFLIKAGIHRLQVVRPKSGNVFVGETGAILSGARELTDFQREGDLWVATGQSQENPRHGPNPYGSEVCSQGRPSCVYPEDLFFDDTPLTQVLSKSDVGPGKWYFDYAGDRIYFHDDPAGRTVETSVAPVAFRPEHAHDLVIRNLIVEKYANPGQVAAIHSTNSDRVRIEGNVVRLNHGAGIHVCCGRDGRIVDNDVYAQGQIGLGSYSATDLLVEGNEIHHNNHAGYWPSWEAGGSKIVRSLRAVVRRNHSYSNEGTGMWTDIDNVDALVEENVVHDNARHGLYHEISYAAVFRNNTVYRNAAHGIVIDSSPNVEVTGNSVWDNGWGWDGSRFQLFGRDTRDGASGRHGPLVLIDLNMHGNTVAGRPLAGLNGPARIYEAAANNRYEGNSYTISSDRPFWIDGDKLTAEEWRARGYDVSSEFN